MNAESVQAAALLYNSQLPKLAAKIRACESKLRFDEHFEELKAVILEPWML